MCIYTSRLNFPMYYCLYYLIDRSGDKIKGNLNLWLNNNKKTVFLFYHQITIRIDRNAVQRKRSVFRIFIKKNIYILYTWPQNTDTHTHTTTTKSILREWSPTTRKSNSQRINPQPAKKKKKKIARTIQRIPTWRINFQKIPSSRVYVYK